MNNRELRKSTKLATENQKQIEKEKVEIVELKKTSAKLKFCIAKKNLPLLKQL